MGWRQLVIAAVVGGAAPGCDVVFGLELPADEPASWLDSIHTHRKGIRIAPPTTTRLTDFPVGVLVDADPDLATSARSDGRDLVFTAADGRTTLDHELERYEEGTLVAWVRVPALAGSTRLYVYYGGDVAPASTTTWSPAFGAVWHLGGAFTATGLDSTEHGNTLAAPGASLEPTVVEGIAGDGRAFDGTGQQLATPSNDTIDAGSGSLSYSLWVKATAHVAFPAEFDSPLAKGGRYPTTPGYLVQLGSGPWTSSVSNGIVQRQVELGEFDKLAGAWVHIAGVIDLDRDELRVFVDGVPRARASLGGVSCASPATELSLSPAHDPFLGAIDEVRIFRVAQEATWFATEFANLTDPAFLTASPEEARPPGLGVP